MTDSLSKVATAAYDGSTPAPRAIGRPRKEAPPYLAPVWRQAPPEDIARQIEQLASGHMGKERIAVELGTSLKTFNRWLQDDPVLDECFKRGKAKAEHELYMLIVEDARAGKKLNMPAVYALNNRHAWRMEKHDETANINVTMVNLAVSQPLDEYLKSVGVSRESGQRVIEHRAER